MDLKQNIRKALNPQIVFICLKYINEEIIKLVDLEAVSLVFLYLRPNGLKPVTCTNRGIKILLRLKNINRKTKHIFC